MDEFSYVLIRNERPPLAGMLGAVARALPHLTWNAVTGGTPLDIYFSNLEPRPGWSKEMLEWHSQACSWIPRDILDWWLQWFGHEEHLEAMSYGWWLSRTMALAVALDGDVPVGVAALTIVVGDESWQAAFAIGSQEVSFEIRSVVVDPRYRRRGIFNRLCRELVDEAVRLSEARQSVDRRLPTFIASQNPDLQRLFRRWRSELTASQQFELDTIMQLVCWHARRLHPPCSHCPMILGNAFAWPTHRPSATWS